MSRKTNIVLAAGTGLTLALMALPDRGAVQPSIESTLQATAPAGTAAVAITDPVDVGVLEAASDAQLEAQRARVAELTWGPDPFAGPAPPDAPAREPVEDVEGPPMREPIVGDVPLPPAARRPHLTGVSRSVDERWAIIDGQIVREKEVLFSGHTLVRIESRSVTLVLEDEVLTLKLGEQR